MTALDRTHSHSDADPTPEEFAEAAAWIARLHGPNRTSRFEKGFQRWLAAKPTHAAAFESMTTAWEAAGRLPQPPFPKVSRWQRIGYRQGFVRSAIAVVAIAALAIGAFFYSQYLRGITTNIGEQRQLTLEDGSRVFLNTSTRIVVRYEKNARRIELKRGEAQFDVAKNPRRPFLVRAGGREIKALGTSFIVRYNSDRTAVTLVEGKVTVTLIAAANAERAGVSSVSPTDRAEVIALAPGQRLTLAGAGVPKLDEPPLERVTAWRRGLVDFDNTPLQEAIAEMNRYSTRVMVLDDANAGREPITGVFRAGDASSFAAAVGRAYQFQVTESTDAVHLSKAH